MNGAREEAVRIARTIRENCPQLLERWMELARSDVSGVPRAAALERDSLIDLVPELITNLQYALERIDPELDATVAARDDGALGAAIRHAEHRHDQGYSITEVLRELGHFRVAIMEICGREGTPLVGPAGRLVHALIDHAIVGGALTIEQREVALLEAERHRAEALVVAKDDFVSLVSHELRTPLNAIVGWTQLARARPILDRTVVTALTTIERNAQLQGRLIDDLLDLARMRNKKMSLELRPLDPLDAVSAAVEDMRPLAMEHDIELEVPMDAALPKVAGDFDRLHQIFSNILANALKFTPRGGRVEVAVAREGGKVRITVRDSGVGIAPDVLPDIFEPFHQGDPTAAGKRHGGVGLGLAIVRELVQLHGGCVSAESPGPGKGATFVVELPALTEEPMARHA